MRRIIACSVVVVALAGGLQVSGLSPWALMLAVGAVAALAWRLSVCRHTGPLALLPPTTDRDGSVSPARWYCDACGATWTARFEKDHTPIRRFTGYDQTKAVTAARRAAELADRQRQLAVQRAGLRAGTGSPGQAAARSVNARKTKAEAESAAAADRTPGVVPIRDGRRFAG